MRLRTGNGMHFKSPRVKRLRNPFYIAALPGRIPAFISNDYRHLFPVQPVMKFSQMTLQPIQFLLVLFFPQTYIQRNLFQSGHLHKRKHILQQRHCQRTVLQCNVNAFRQCLHDLQFRPLPRFCIYNIPWGRRRIGRFQIPVIYFHASVIMLILPFIAFTDPPFCVNILQKSVNPLFLLLLPDLEEKFHHQIPVVRQLSFKTADTVDFCLVSLSVQFPMQA